MKKFNLILCSSLILSCLASSASFAVGNPAIHPGDDSTPLTTNSNGMKDLRLNVILQLLDPKSRAVLSGASRQCRDETKILRDQDYQAHLNSGKPVINLKSSDPRVPEGFKALGPSYFITDPTGLVKPFILSIPAPYIMRFDEVAAYCKSVGGEAATGGENGDSQVEALGRAMRKMVYKYCGPAGTYNTNSISKIRQFFLSGSLHRSGDAITFNGYDGKVESWQRTLPTDIRCVYEIPLNEGTAK